MNIKKSVLISLAFMALTTTAYGKDISVRLNGNDIGTSAIIEDDRSFVPYRAVFEKLGVITHVDAVKEQLPVKLEVIPASPGEHGSIVKMIC